MKFKVGDKVKFLNEKGGGVISKIISPSLVNVSIEDGFEIPVVPSELVLDKEQVGSPGSAESIRPEQTFRKPEVELPAEEEYGERKSSIGKIAFRGTIGEGVFLAYVPHDQKWLVTGEMDLCLINNTKFEVLFSFFTKDDEGSFEGIDYDVLEPRTKILIDTFDREDIENWNRGVVQLLFHTDSSDKLFLPANCSFDIKPARIYKESNYKETPLLEEKAFVFNLLEMSHHNTFGGSDAEKKFDKQEKTIKKAEQVKKKSLIDKHRTTTGEAVVDLHIGELVTNITGLTSGDMIKIQMDYFSRTLESAIANNYTRVTFIHGVGNGVLKNKIVEGLKEYEGLEKRSASLAKFGVGAVDVIIGDVN